jgi:hypothetical protein
MKITIGDHNFSMLRQQNKHYKEDVCGSNLKEARREKLAMGDQEIYVESIHPVRPYRTHALVVQACLLATLGSHYLVCPLIYNIGSSILQKC